MLGRATVACFLVSATARAMTPQMKPMMPSASPALAVRRGAVREVAARGAAMDERRLCKCCGLVVLVVVVLELRLQG